MFRLLKNSSKVNYHFIRRYATNPQFSPEEFAQIRLKEINDKIHSHPPLLNAYTNLQTILKEKNHLIPGKKPGYFQILQMMADKEVKSAIDEIAKQLKDANLDLSKDDLQPLMELLKKTN